ncbi:hypothetical protein ACWCP8_41100 [Streptomyces sp. NPDC002206]
MFIGYLVASVQPRAPVWRWAGDHWPGSGYAFAICVGMAVPLSGAGAIFAYSRGGWYRLLSALGGVLAVLSFVLLLHTLPNKRERRWGCRDRCWLVWNYPAAWFYALLGVIAGGVLAYVLVKTRSRRRAAHAAEPVRQAPRSPEVPLTADRLAAQWPMPSVFKVIAAAAGFTFGMIASTVAAYAESQRHGYQALAFALPIWAASMALMLWFGLRVRVTGDTSGRHRRVVGGIGLALLVLALSPFAFMGGRDSVEGWSAIFALLSGVMIGNMWAFLRVRRSLRATEGVGILTGIDSGGFARKQ